jgi:hypothetical protein
MDINGNTILTDDFHNIRMGTTTSIPIKKNDNQGIAHSAVTFGTFGLITYAGGYVQWTTDNGATWSNTTYASTARAAIDRSTGKVLIVTVGPDSEVFYSTDSMVTVTSLGTVTNFSIHGSTGFEPIALHGGKALLAGVELGDLSTLYLLEGLS